jgi:hypothetical protein
MARSARNIAGLAVGVGTLLGAAALARRPLTQTEICIFRKGNDLAGRSYPAIWIPMQYGSFGTVPAAAAVALVRRRPHLALAIGTAGTAAWVLAKAVKPIVDRRASGKAPQGRLAPRRGGGRSGLPLRARGRLRRPHGRRLAVRVERVAGHALGPLLVRAVRSHVRGSPPPTGCGGRFRARSRARQRRHPRDPDARAPWPKPVGRNNRIHTGIGVILADQYTYAPVRRSQSRTRARDAEKVGGNRPEQASLAFRSQSTELARRIDRLRRQREQPELHWAPVRAHGLGACVADRVPEQLGRRRVGLLAVVSGSSMPYASSVAFRQLVGNVPGYGYSPGRGSSGPHETGTSLGAPATSSSESAIRTPGPQCARPVPDTVIADADVGTLEQVQQGHIRLPAPVVEQEKASPRPGRRSESVVPAERRGQRVPEQEVFKQYGADLKWAMWSQDSGIEPTSRGAKRIARVVPRRPPWRLTSGGDAGRAARGGRRPRRPRRPPPPSRRRGPVGRSRPPPPAGP